MLGWALAFRQRLLDDPDPPILVWAAGCYALALMIDAFGQLVGWGGVREETAKLIGVAAWLIFFWRTTCAASICATQLGTDERQLRLRFRPLR